MNLSSGRSTAKALSAAKPIQVIARPPPDQVEVREHFRKAGVYGRMALANAAARKLYEDASTKKGKPIFSMVMADFLNAPTMTPPIMVMTSPWRALRVVGCIGVINSCSTESS